MRLFTMLRSRRLLSRLTFARRMAVKFEHDALAIRQRLDKKMDQLTRLQSELNSLSNEVQVDVQRMESLERAYQTTVDALREENRILSESTIPVLVGSHKLLQERYEAEIAILSQQRAAMTEREE